MLGGTSSNNLVRCSSAAFWKLGSTPVQARGILRRPEEQSRTGGCQSSSIEDQPQCRWLWHSSSPSAHSLSRSPSPPPPSFTQSPSPPRLVRDGQTSPHRPRLVVSHSTCPPLSSPPTRIIGPAVIKYTHFPGTATEREQPRH